MRQQGRKLIVGGHNIAPGRYPYYVSMDKNNGVGALSGALIAPDIVLSAGHIALNHMENLTLEVGPYAVHNVSEPLVETIPVESWLVPPSWSQFAPSFFRDDYLILKLAHSSTHQPIQINWDFNVPVAGQHVIMMGLGWLNGSYVSPASIVQQVELVAIGNDECETAVDPVRQKSYQGKIEESMLCTKAPPNTTRDGCAWDSGAPVIVAGDTSKDDVLVGLGSTGVACADKVFPGIQARVATDFALKWIREQVCQLSVDPPAEFHCSTTVSLLVDNALVTTALVTPRLHPTSSNRFTRAVEGLLLFKVVAFVALVVVGYVRGKTKNRTETTTDGDERSTKLASKKVYYGSVS